MIGWAPLGDDDDEEEDDLGQNFKHLPGAMK